MLRIALFVDVSQSHLEVHTPVVRSSPPLCL